MNRLLASDVRYVKGPRSLIKLSCVYSTPVFCPRLCMRLIHRLDLAERRAFLFSKIEFRAAKRTILVRLMILGQIPF